MLGLFRHQSTTGNLLDSAQLRKAENGGKNYRPPHPKGMKGGCSPQNSFIYGT